MHKTLLFSFFILFPSVCALAQFTLAPSVVASGGNYHSSTEGNMSISWTIGELAVTTLVRNDRVLTQGFQQPFRLGTGEEKEKKSGAIYVYPNPVHNELFVRFDMERPGDFLLELQDVTGRIMSQIPKKPVHPGDIIPLNVSNYLPGLYLLKVITTDGQPVHITTVRVL